MRLFRRRKHPHQVQQVTSNLFRVACLSLQRKWVHLMQRLDNKCTLRQKKVILIIFCTAGCIYCISLGLHAFNRQPHPHSPIPTTPLIKSGQPDPLSDSKLSAADTVAIRGFRSAIDSMLKTNAGKAALDSLQAIRPGLLDSFYQMERTIQ
ncbi:hypothetical protein [Niastella sp. OAS944]|uniref:hypothetical protein n=1 Tax=Niastella sp. OAS944 TaxID=2664089 RepID=UPI00349B8A42|nr:hypothetical protein [Chitinophagaceae bacterium OAS944]